MSSGWTCALCATVGKNRAATQHGITACASHAKRAVANPGHSEYAGTTVDCNITNAATGSTACNLPETELNSISRAYPCSATLTANS
jgi:hypothetical protein